MRRSNPRLEFEDDGASFRVRQMWRREGRSPFIRWWKRLSFTARLLVPWLLVAAFVVGAAFVLLALIVWDAVTGSG